MGNKSLEEARKKILALRCETNYDETEEKLLNAQLIMTVLTLIDSLIEAELQI